jgi:hypothetical protein
MGGVLPHLQTYLAGAGGGSCSSVSFTRAAHGTSEVCKGEEDTTGIARGTISACGRERSRFCQQLRIRINVREIDNSNIQSTWRVGRYIK